ncbi:hypothetical protein M011DRAFT_471856 [Sporormia fimetaria CBS 119925]|uniref:Uncharacterized protein n=1 Tax=Sporormia fimetaria CBS 119925 TaxID=1340428 RepID=A0A6A6UXG9_9PLEO|nr:hypothetical protein M011DRAFT_471856 [Sporormia fimetaria CBS 119925]
MDKKGGYWFLSQVGCNTARQGFGGIVWDGVSATDGYGLLRAVMDMIIVVGDGVCLVYLGRRTTIM